MILLVSPRNIPANLDGYAWVFAGREGHYQDVHAMLERAGAISAFSPEEYDSLVAEIREPFRNWLDNIHDSNGADPYYWAMEEFSGHPMTTSLFTEMCALAAIGRLIEGSVLRLIVICEDVGLADAVQILARSRGISVKSSMDRTPLWQKVRPFFSHSYHCLWSFTVFSLARIFGSAVNSTNDVDVLSEFIIHDTQVSDAGTADRYIGGITDWLEKQGLRLAFYPIIEHISPWKIAGILRRLKRGNQRIFLQERLLGYLDLFRALIFPFVRPAVVHIPDFLGMDVSSIIAANRSSRRFAWASVDAVLRYFCAEKLARIGVKPKMLIAWDESQMINRMCYRGFHDFLPNTELVGVRPVTPMRNWFAMAPSVIQAKCGVQPDRYLVPGTITRDYMKECDPLALVEIAPLPRFFYIIPSLEDASAGLKRKQGKCILLMLPMFMEWAVQIIAMTTSLCQGYRIIVKPHPYLGKERLSPVLIKRGISMDNLEFVSDDLNFLFQQADVVVSRQSITMVEALCAGVLVIELVSPYATGLSQIDDMPKELWRRVYSQDAFKDAISWAFHHPLSVSERQSAGLRLVEQVFCRYDDTNMLKYLPSMKDSSMNLP